MEKLRKAKKGASTISRDGNNINNKEISTSRLDSPTSSCKEASDDKAAELPAKGFQVGLIFSPLFSILDYFVATSKKFNGSYTDIRHIYIRSHIWSSFIRLVLETF